MGKAEVLFPLQTKEEQAQQYEWGDAPPRKKTVLELQGSGSLKL